MRTMLASPAPLLVVCALFWVCIVGLFHVAHAQTSQTQSTTDPDEARALNSVFQQWRIPADQKQWNISGEPCSGVAINSSSTPSSSPWIKCNCSYKNGAICHITQLNVYGLNVVGEIPDELWTLTFLTSLDLRNNYLTGPLSPSIGNLTRMESLRLEVNALSGELPKELGMLSNMIIFAIGTNNFSGPLPSELGNWTKLGSLFIDSSGVSGQIPLTFINLQRMTVIWAHDTELTGRIPDFIGNWTMLKTLIVKFQGNAFDGPIPSSFSRLTNMTRLTISDLSNGSSTLAFIKNMKSLRTLELRNNNISDSIPSDIGEYQSLELLDLSFNNLGGEISDSLFNLSSLNNLFLGNNKLNGTLPAQKSTSLQNIDVSYNNLIGSLPSWISERDLQLNLVANNFTIDNSNNRNGYFSGQFLGIRAFHLRPLLFFLSVLLSTLKCLQRNFSCNQGHGIYNNFSVKCGGLSGLASNGYEIDYAQLHRASYFVTNTSRWGVSNVGFTRTLQDSQLPLTARLSTSSLRYYGLGLENGKYNVTLHFAELDIPDNTSWQSLGRRVFDVYIQGNRVLKDFNIKKAAGGASRQDILRKFTAQVSKNYLEIHLFWAGKGTSGVLAQGATGPSISSISATSNLVPPTSNKKNRLGLIVGIVIGVVLVIFLSIIPIYWIVRRRKRSSDNDEVLLGIDVRPYTFSYAELKLATDGFNLINKLGEGGFGPVYKGKLADGRVIAVKQLSVASRQGTSQFIAEIIAISVVQHRNLVKLYGCCIEGVERLVVYEYLENKSLDQALFGQRSLILNWTTRYDICLGVARGLTYLHEDLRRRIIHRDIKASNILLDSELIPKISDFGLAKLYDDNKTHISTRVAGTIGYLAPEYALRGHLTEKTDVFAFGVMTLEIVSGRPNSDSSFHEEQLYLLDWAWHLHENNREVELVDPRLSEFNEEEVIRMIRVALLCTQTLPSMRPRMSRAIAMLCGDVEVSKVTTKPGYLTDWKFDDITNLTTSDEATKGTDCSYYTPSSTIIAAKASHLEENGAKPISHD